MGYHDPSDWRDEVLQVALLVTAEAEDRGHDMSNGSTWHGRAVKSSCRLCGGPLNVEWVPDENAVSVSGVNLSACTSSGYQLPKEKACN